MDYNRQTLTAIIHTLKSLFAEKNELKGFDDWDAFIGCIIALEGVASGLEKPSEETAEE